jgi:hypothetical protein
MIIQKLRVVELRSKWNKMIKKKKFSVNSVHSVVKKIDSRLTGYKSRLGY